VNLQALLAIGAGYDLPAWQLLIGASAELAGAELAAGQRRSQRRLMIRIVDVLCLF
jgi:hypothetical protein